MFPHINKQNIEAWLLDLAEGNLSAQEIKDVKQFMSDHPEYQHMYLDDVQQLQCYPTDELTDYYLESDFLKKSSPSTSEQEALFLYSDSPQQNPLPIELQKALSNDLLLQKHLQAYQAARLIPDKNIHLDASIIRSLKRKNYSPISYRIAAITTLAAILLGAFFYFSFLNAEQQPLEKVIASQENNPISKSEKSENSDHRSISEPKESIVLSQTTLKNNPPVVVRNNSSIYHSISSRQHNHFTSTQDVISSAQVKPIKENISPSSQQSADIPEYPTTLAMPYALAAKYCNITEFAPIYFKRIETQILKQNADYISNNSIYSMDRFISLGDKMLIHSMQSLERINNEGLFGVESIKDPNGDITALSLRIGELEVSRPINKNSIINKL